MLILHVVGRLAVGGAEGLIMNIYNRAKKDNVQFDFVAHGSVASYKEEIEASCGFEKFRFGSF